MITTKPISAFSQIPQDNENSEENNLEDIQITPRDTLSRFQRLPTIISAVAVITGILAIIMTLPGVWVLVATVLIGAGILSITNIDRQRAIGVLCAAAVGVTTIDYIAWRWTVTNWHAWWIAIPLLIAETFGAIHTFGLHYTIWPRKDTPAHYDSDPTQRPVFVFIPTVNEGPAILRPTINGALAARRRYLQRYPHGHVSVIVCNDGFVAQSAGWEETEALCKNLGVTCITRQIGGGAKAGNIEFARQIVGAHTDALMVIFDADQIATDDFLLQTIPPFADHRIGWVQTGQYYSNLENPVARWANDQQSLFYRVLCPGKARQNAAFICGTNVVLRTSALDEIGGLPQDSVTEDFAASIKLHSRWHSIFLPEVLATGLGPMDLPAYLKQQQRWAIGTLSVMRTHWRDILLPGRNGLTVEQRFQYALACTHYLCGVRDAIYLVVPILFLATGVPAVRGSTLEQFIWHFLPYWVASLVAFWYVGRGHQTGLRGIIIGFGSFPTLIVSFITAFTGRKIGFAVTSKQRQQGRPWGHLVLYAVLLAVCATSIIVTFARLHSPTAPFLISMLWVGYTMLMLTGWLWLGIRDLRGEIGVQPKRQLLTLAQLQSFASTRGVRIAGSVVLLLVIVASGIGFTKRDASAAATPFIVSLPAGNSPYAGLTVPVEFLTTKPAQVSKEVHEQFAIIGRTQEINDQFDRTWANQLAAHHQQPWVTLQFGTIDATGKPPLNAGLDAVANGLQDQQLLRWASEIRDYGKPVYVTILLHVDRNWSVSSAVANGGIPQDSTRAWLHVRQLFAKVGAINVAWVWAPADPSHDQLFAPPENQIDIVLVSMIAYPGTQWVNPTTMVTAVTARHPTKPLFVEISAAGAADQKAAWLNQVNDTLGQSKIKNIYALFYHEGSPDTTATALQHLQWSVESDPLSLQAMIRVYQHTRKLP